MAMTPETPTADAAAPLSADEVAPIEPPRHSGLTIEQQQRALFVSDRGTGLGALDVISGGVAGSQGRVPALRWVLENSTLPYHRVVAAMILAAWGDLAALQLIAAWAESPEGTPPAIQSDSQDLFSRADNAFELLCGGVGTWIADEPTHVRATRIGTLRALIGVSPRHYVGRGISRAVADLQVPWVEIATSIDAATHEILDLLAREERDDCDRPFQAAVLVGLLAQHNEAAGTRAAQVLLSNRLPERAEREIIIALGHARGRDTDAYLASLASGTGSRATVAKEALRQRHRPYRPTTA